jgi:predicted AAA+ superfamily ATPase
MKDFFSVEKELPLSLLNEYLNFGGYPRVVLESKLVEKNRTISEIFRSYTEKDIAYFLGANKIEKFELLIKLLADQSGKIINYSELAKETGISFQTLKNYLWYAEKTFSIRTILPYFRNKRKEITHSPLAYFYDLGFRNFSLGLFGNLVQPDQLGFVFQNFIANRLHEKNANTAKNLGFWRTLDMAEVDFVISEGKSVLPIEVKYSQLKKPQITRSLGNFIKAYSPDEAWVVNLTLEAEIKIADTKVKFIPYYAI